MPFELLLSFVMQLLSMPPREKRMITDNFHENRFGYSSSRVFFSCMAFSINEVVCIACQSHSWFVLCTFMGRKQTNYATDCQATRTTSQTLKAMKERNLCLQCKVWQTHCRMAFITVNEHWKYCSHWRPVLTKWHSHCLPGKMRSRLLSLSGVCCYRNGCCVQSHFQKMHAYENHAFHGRHCKVSPRPNSHLNTSKPVKHRVIRN